MGSFLFCIISCLQLFLLFYFESVFFFKPLDEYFFNEYKTKSVLFAHGVSNFLPALLKRKIKINFLLAS